MIEFCLGTQTVDSNYVNRCEMRCTAPRNTIKIDLYNWPKNEPKLRNPKNRNTKIDENKTQREKEIDSVYNLSQTHETVKNWAETEKEIE